MCDVCVSPAAPCVKTVGDLVVFMGFCGYAGVVLRGMPQVCSCLLWRVTVFYLSSQLVLFAIWGIARAAACDAMMLQHQR
jgi:hypothetical protein